MAQGPHHYAVGAALILLVDVLWTSSNYLSSTVLTHGYDKPFAVTYLSTATFIVYLIPIAALYYTQSSGQRNESPMPLWWERLGFRPPHMRPATYTHPHSHSALENSLPSEELALPRPKRPSSIDGRRPKSDLRLPMDPSESHPSILDFTIRGRSPQPSGERRPLRTPSRESLTSYMSDADCEDTHTSAHVISASELPPLSVTETFYLSMEFAVIWFAANWSFVAGLAYTSVASGTTLGSTSGFFTLLLGSLVGTDSFSPGKLASVLLSFCGVALVTWSDQDSANPSNPLWGDTLALVSALCYAGYVTLLKVRIGSEDRISMPLFLGFVGAFNLLAFWPMGLVLHVLGVEPLGLPQDSLMLWGLVTNMLVTVISDFAYLLAMLKSSPLLTTIGLSLTIPMAFLGDLLQDPRGTTMSKGIGSILVLFSFGAIAWEENR